MYADDTVLYCGHECNRIVRKRIQADLIKVQAWCTENRLSLNVKKNKIMTFMSDHKRKRYDKFRLYMKGVVIEEVENYRYLGTEIDTTLSGEEQYTKLVRTLRAIPTRQFMTTPIIFLIGRLLV